MHRPAPPPLPSLLVVSLLAATLLSPARAAACATCGSGDPTLTTMGLGSLGQGPSFAGRLRFGLELRYRWDHLDGATADAVTLHEGRAAFSASYAFDDRIALAARLPVVLRGGTWSSLRSYVTLGPSDLDLRARVVLLRDRRFAPSHLLGVTAGVGLPTSIDQVDRQGARLPAEVQSGSGAITPVAGVFYTHLADPLALFASAVVSVPLAGRFDETGGPSLRGSFAAQQRVAPWLSVREGVDLRWDVPALIEGVRDPESSHFTVFASPDLLFAPAPDWVVSVGVRIPIFQVSVQGRAEGWMWLASVAVDA